MCGGNEDELTKKRQENYAKADYSDPHYEGEKTDPKYATGP